MAENSQIVELQRKTTDFKSSKTLSAPIPLLPRSAWKSQVTYLKVLLKAKQALDNRGRLNEIADPANPES